VAVQLTILKRLFLKNDENLGILIYCVTANHGVVNIIDSQKIGCLRGSLAVTNYLRISS
jgi:hypothetical protein